MGILHVQRADLSCNGSLRAAVTEKEDVVRWTPTRMAPVGHPSSADDQSPVGAQASRIGVQ